LSKKCKGEIKVVMRRALPNPSDIVRINSLAYNGLNTADYVMIYEKFEIKTNFKVYSHIISGSVDYSNDNFVQFYTDDDLNDNITNLGSTIRKVYNIGDKQYSCFKRILLSYDAIVSIEPIIHVPLSSR
jgi:hypothetical protein